MLGKGASTTTGCQERCFIRVWLELQVGFELQIARTIRLIAYCAKSSAVDVGIDSTELCSVEKVKGVRLKSETQSLDEFEVLADC